MIRAKVINAAAITVILGGVYGGCAMAAAVTGYPPPISGVVVLGVAWIFSGLIDGVTVLAAQVRTSVGRARHRRYVRGLNAAFEDYGITYRIGSPPSHAAGGAR